MALRRFSLDYGSPGVRIRPRRPDSESAHALLCLAKLIGYMAIAVAIGSIFSLGVAGLYELISGFAS